MCYISSSTVYTTNNFFFSICVALFQFYFVLFVFYSRNLWPSSEWKMWRFGLQQKTKNNKKLYCAPFEHGPVVMHLSYALFFSCCAGCSVILYSRYFIYALRESKRPAREKIKELSNVFSRMGAMWFSAWKIPKTLYFVLLQCVLSLCVILYEAQHIWGYTYCITMFQSSAFAFYLCTALRFFFYSLQMMQNVENRQNSIVYRWLVCVAHGKLIVHSIKKNSVCKGWKCKLQFRRCWRCENVECSKATNKATLTGTNCKCCLR